MATRRKSSRQKKKNQVQVPFPVVLANVLVLVTVLGLSYMWLCARCDALGREIKEKERELADAEKRCNNEQERWAIMTSPLNLKQTLGSLGLEMRMPSDSQIVKMGHWNIAGRTAMSDSKSLIRQ